MENEHPASLIHIYRELCHEMLVEINYPYCEMHFSFTILALNPRTANTTSVARTEVKKLMKDSGYSKFDMEVPTKILQECLDKLVA